MFRNVEKIVDNSMLGKLGGGEKGIRTRDSTSPSWRLVHLLACTLAEVLRSQPDRALGNTSCRGAPRPVSRSILLPFGCHDVPVGGMNAELELLTY